MNKRRLKKQIHALSSDMVLETSIIAALVDKVDENKAKEVMKEIFSNEVCLASNANKKVGKRGDKAVKTYYADLIKEWNKTIAESYKKINDLSGK